MKTRLLVAGLAVVLPLAACDGDDDPTTPNDLDPIDTSVDVSLPGDTADMPLTTTP